VKDHGIIESELTRQIEAGIKSLEPVTAREEDQNIVISRLKSPTRKAEPLSAGFTYLKAIPKKTLNLLIQAAILGEPILFLGNEYTFNVISDTLLLFNHQGVSRKIFLKGQVTLPGNYNAVGIDSNQKVSRKIKNSYYLSYSLDNQRIEHKGNIKEGDFAGQWTSNLFKASSIDEIIEKFQTYIKERIQPYASQIINKLVQSQDSKQSIENSKKLILNLRKSLDKSDYDLIIELAIRSNPILENFMKKELFAEQFVINGW